MNSQKDITILFDHQAFEMQKFGGISRYFYELIENLPLHSELSLRLTTNHYLREGACRPFQGMYVPERPYKWFKGIVKQWNRKGSIKQLHRGDYDLFHPTYYHPYFIEKQLTQALSLQYRSGDLKDNGMAVIERLEKAFSAFVPKLEEQVHLNIEQLKGEYEDLGLTEESAYLHVRGHNLYALVKSIGVHLVPDFEYEVLLKELPNSTDYRELSDVVADLNIILSEE